MTNRNWPRRALLGGSAACILATAAHADGLSAFNITPTADMPAPTTDVSISGNVRGLLLSEKTGNGWNTDLASRLRLYIKGKTETSAGEVGAYARLQADASTGKSADVSANSFYGYWKATDSLTLTAGHNDTVAAVLHGADWNGTGGVWNGSAAVLTDPTVEFASLGFGSGPFTATVAVESNTSANAAADDELQASSPAIAGSLVMKEGSLSAEATGRYQNSDDGSSWMVGGGIGYSAGIVSAEVGAATGRGMAKDFTTFDLTDVDVLGSDFTAVNGLVTLHMTETTRLEAFAGYGKLGLSGGIANAGNPESKVGVGGGVFWSPVAQLTLGAGASWSKTRYDDNADAAVSSTSATTAGVGAWFSF